jgi:hypothetical protein
VGTGSSNFTDVILADSPEVWNYANGGHSNSPSIMVMALKSQGRVGGLRAARHAGLAACQRPGGCPHRHTGGPICQARRAAPKLGLNIRPVRLRASGGGQAWFGRVVLKFLALFKSLLLMKR